ncbi:non-canonical purine NTP pyrophosphatase [uncultured Clostridium sp.]|uniref:non-canonical purine NTP pyrophosphatase n=1 Tax=uncultured Clostridium sp. TaxID=59620 RepID=UPI002589C258|nr:non-canonical purine NTP pyrophosphatase [uncultured Clostridium sp.]MDU1349705.1 non-canonical purine NTP pyrophosphatase [Clostridium argentinense]
MKLLYGTSNPAKLLHMKNVLEGLDIEVIGLKDVDLKFDEIDESGNEPLENARIKALAYYRVYRRPVFSCDSGLYIEGLSKENQPGVHVRRVNGKSLNDEEMIDYYSFLAKKLGGQAKARYKNGICLVIDDKNIFEYDGEDIGTGSFIISSKPHKKRNEGFPLDSLSVDIESNRYYIDMENNKKNKDDNIQDKAFREFFRRTILRHIEKNI